MAKDEPPNGDEGDKVVNTPLGMKRVSTLVAAMQVKDEMVDVLRDVNYFLQGFPGYGPAERLRDRTIKALRKAVSV